MLKNKSTFILASGGKGTRFKGSKKPKQYLEVKSIPIFIYSLLGIEKLNFIDEIIITKNKDINEKLISDKLKKFGILKNIKIINGGKTRFESVKKAFYKSKSNNAFTIIHDAVRPNFNFNDLSKMIRLIKRFDGIIPVEKIDSTIKRIDKLNINNTVPRENLFLSQTPQIFKTQSLLDCYENNRNMNYTDESQMLEENGYKVRSYLYDKFNLKITTRNDLENFRSLIK